MRKFKSVYIYIVYLLILAVHLQCKGINEENNTDTQTNNTATQKVTANDIAQIKYTEYVLSDLAQKRTNDWFTFKLLTTEIENLKKGNLSFFIDDITILKGFVDELINETPELLTVSSIMVRISVIKTAIYKLEDTSTSTNIDKQPILNNIEDLLLAYNHLLLQINKRVEKESRNIKKPQ